MRSSKRSTTVSRLACAIAAALLAFGCSTHTPPSPVQDQGLDLTILHVNDTHAYLAGTNKRGGACLEEEPCTGGFSRIAATIRKEKAAHDNVLALDAGDQFQGTLFYSVNKWKIFQELDKVMPYDAMTLGNHEWDEGCDELAQFVKSLPYPVLAANLAPSKGCALEKIPTLPWIIREVRGTKVGIVGLANDEVCSLSLACKKTRFADRAATLKKAVAELEAKGVKHIIALTHVGYDEDKKLAAQVEGIDVFVGGHSHTYLAADSDEGPYPTIVRSPKGHPVLVVTAKNAAKYVGRLNVRFDQEGIPVAWNGGPQEQKADFARAADVSELVKKDAARIASLKQSKVGVNTISMADGLDLCRNEECLSGLIAADSMLAYGRQFGAQVALIQGGGIRSGLNVGDVSLGNLLEIMPFGNSIVLRDMTGATLWEAIEHAVSEKRGDNAYLLQPAGLRYSADMSRPKGQRVLAVEIKDAKGTYRPLNKKATYRVVLTQYLANGGDFFSMLAKTRPVVSTTPIDLDLFGDFIMKNSPLTTIERNRITWK